jgi:hypothetical protein
VNINKEWHEENRMPPKATIEERIRWHAEHVKNCPCRGAPDKVIEEAAKRGIVIPKG